MATGPNGKQYHTWHPQRDPATGCYFGHEHGSNPANFAGAANYRPLFGYVNELADMPEPHSGFKIFLMDDGKGRHWMWTVHLGSSGQGRVCNPFHTAELAIANMSAGEILAVVRFIGDFGRSESNGSPFPALTPANCPTQYKDSKDRGSTGAKQFSVNSIGNDSHQYEPWRLDYSRTIFGLSNTSIAFNNRTAMTTCADLDCSQMLPTNHRGGGAFRVIQVGAMRLTAPSSAGNFTTDAHGHTRGGPLPQYIKTGLDITMQTVPTGYNYWPGTDPIAADFKLRSNDPTVKDGKGDMAKYNIDGKLLLGN